MTATAKRPRAARSTKVRPQVDPCPDEGRLGSFPPPTPWSEQLAADNLQLAKAMANRLSAQTRMPFDDLYLVAAQGLLKGCRRYDPDRLNPATGRPYALSTCVVPFIRGAMAQWLRDRGHSSGVKFPDRWRDVAPTVRRLAGQGATMTAVTEATGLPPEEVEAILQAQGVTTQLDPETYGSGDRDPDPWDEAEGYHELAEALAIADRAHAALRWADRAMLEQAWQSPRRRQLARLPHGQFLRHVHGILRGVRPAREEQQSLSLAIEEPAQILGRAEQLALADPCHDKGSGKTAAADVKGAGAAGD